MKQYIVAPEVPYLRHPKDRTGCEARKADRTAEVEWTHTMSGKLVPPFVVEASPYLVEQGKVVEREHKEEKVTP